MQEETLQAEEGPNYPKKFNLKPNNYNMWTNPPWWDCNSNNNNDVWRY
jgi:hypothetical protein